MYQARKHFTPAGVFAITLTLIAGLCFSVVSNKLANSADVGLVAQEKTAGAINRQARTLRESIAEYESFKRQPAALRLHKVCGVKIVCPATLTK